MTSTPQSEQGKTTYIPTENLGESRTGNSGMLETESNNLKQTPLFTIQQLLIF